MESLEDSNCQSMSDSFSLYERYMRSFNVGDSKVEDNGDPEGSEPASSSNSDSESSNSRDNIDLSTAQSQVMTKRDLSESDCNLINQGTCDYIEKSLDTLFVKVDSSCTSPMASLNSFQNSCATNEHSHMTDKSDQTDMQASSEETKRTTFKQPIFLTSTMENSNNAVDSVPMFRNVKHGESVFKLPIRELTFNGTLKHVQKLKPIVDPISAMSSDKLDLDEKYTDNTDPQPCGSECADIETDQKSYDLKYSDISQEASVYEMNRIDKTSESTGDSQYEELTVKKEGPVNEDASTNKWNLDQSHSSFEASFDSGVRSPDMFSDNGDDLEPLPECEPFWSFVKDYEAYDKRKVRRIEETLQGVLPPPSVTILKTDVTEMLKKYYSHLPLFNDNTTKLNVSEEANSMTPTKRVSFIEIPEVAQNITVEAQDITVAEQDASVDVQDTTGDLSARPSSSTDKSKFFTAKDKLNGSEQELDTSANDKTIDYKMCTQIEATETAWPDILKCRYYDVYYNVTKYSEKFELLSLRYGERYIGAETDTSVNIYSGGFQSPSSASKRKALRLKMAQAKSPGRRLSHLARRRQAFCSAATINEKAQASTAKMVLIDKNYFPHRKLINSAERKSPRFRRTPGKRTPSRKTPGKKTPAKTPKTRSGGSSKKKAMRRLLMDSDSMSQSQSSRESLKRALFISPENRKTVPQASCTTAPAQAMRTKRALFGSPEKPADAKSSDGSMSDQFLKRKLSALDDPPENSRSKIAKSLSFGGDTMRTAQSISFSRRASEVFTAKRSVELNENHKQKLLWAVSEALRIHGWRMSSPGFREKASTLARLTRRLLTLPPHAAKLAAANLSTSDTILKIARQYVFAIIQGRTVEDCFQEEQMKIANDVSSKVSGYISANAYQQIRARQTATATFTSQIKENSCSSSSKLEQTKSGTKNVLQDKLVNIDSNSTNSNSSSGLSSIDKASLGLFKSNSMPSFEEAAKMKARRQISFDNVDFPKR